MIPIDGEFDIYVTECGVLVEVWHGTHVSVAQQFGVDWDGPVSSVMHSTVFTDPNAPTVHCRVHRGRLRRLLWRRSRSVCAWLVLSLTLGAAIGWLVARGLVNWAGADVFR